MDDSAVPWSTPILGKLHIENAGIKTVPNQEDETTQGDAFLNYLGRDGEEMVDSMSKRALGNKLDGEFWKNKVQNPLIKEMNSNI